MNHESSSWELKMLILGIVSHIMGFEWPCGNTGYSIFSAVSIFLYSTTLPAPGLQLASTFRAQMTQVVTALKLV